MEYVLGGTILVLAAGLVWSSVTAVRLALARRDDAIAIGVLTTERNAALASAATEADRAQASTTLGMAGQHGIANAAKEKISDLQNSDSSVAAINAARRIAGLPDLAPGVPGVRPAPTEAAPSAGPDAVRPPGGDGGA